MGTAPILSLYWFAVLGGLGVWFPFYSLYLSENAGLTGSQVGMVMAMLPLVGMVAQPLWGQLADRTGSRAGVLTLVGICAAVGYAALARANSFPGFLLGTAALACFSTAIMPNAVSITLAIARPGKPHDFGMSRVWGTFGFFALDRAPPRSGPRVEVRDRLGTRSRGVFEIRSHGICDGQQSDLAHRVGNPQQLRGFGFLKEMKSG